MELFNHFPPRNLLLCLQLQCNKSIFLWYDCSAYNPLRDISASKLKNTLESTRSNYYSYVDYISKIMAHITFVFKITTQPGLNQMASSLLPVKETFLIPEIWV